jgi:G protein-coupled receptor 128
MVYQNHKLFQSKTFTATSDFSQKIISSKINESEQQRQNKVSVEMVFNPTVSFSMNGNKNSVYSFFFFFF